MSWVPRHRVVVPVDFSDESFAAVDEALRLVEDASHLHIIHVLQPLAPADPALMWNARIEESSRTRVREYLKTRLQDAKYAGHHVTVAEGSPAEEIADFAERLGADLIVLPSHGRKGLRRLLIGSVAERVVRLAHCPVLVLRNGGGQ
jgi:nucleotide-binding universal stress UspA family protein